MATDKLDQTGPWYKGITRYQWLVLIIASLGWVFDIFEGQIFVASMNEAIPSLYPEHVQQMSPTDQEGYKSFYVQITFGAFLLGGALGGVIFGIVSDRVGRKRAMTYTILMYSLFTCISAFSFVWWHMAVFRFLVAMGVGGEWAVASALVAEVFPKRARAWSLGIFHASSVLGTYLAIAAGEYVVNNPAIDQFAKKIGKEEWWPVWIDPVTVPWRIGFVFGLLPALLIIWVRMSLKEPETWEKAKSVADKDATRKMGSFTALFAPDIIRNTLVGVSLAAIGMGTFWGVHVFGKDLVRNELRAMHFGFKGRKPDPDESMLVVDSFDKAVKKFDANSESVSPAVQLALKEARVALSGPGLGYLQNQISKKLNPQEYEADPAEMFTQLSVDEAKVVQGILIATEQPFNRPIKSWAMLAMFVTTTGGGIGLILFGPISDAYGRRRTFLFFHLGGFVIALITLNLVSGVGPLLLFLPLFGFLTLGMHAGYAVYFPELFPTRLRGSGGGFCFNVGRVLAAPILFLAGWMQRDWNYSLNEACSLLSLLFLLGVVVIPFAKETRGEELPK